MTKTTKPYFLNDQRLQVITILFFIFALTFFTFVPSFAQDNQNDCQIYKIEYHPLYKYTDSYSETKKILNLLRNSACARVDDGRWTLEYGTKVMNAYVLRYSYCRDFYINPSFHSDMKDNDVPEVIFKVYEKFCRDTYDPKPKHRAVKREKMLDRMSWLSTELFCQSSRYIAHSDGWEEVLRPSELSSVKRLDAAAISICDDLRGGKILYDEAIYRWEQELLWFDSHFPTEAVQKYIKQLIKPFKEVLDGLLEKFK